MFADSSTPHLEIAQTPPFFQLSAVARVPLSTCYRCAAVVAVPTPPPPRQALRVRKNGVAASLKTSSLYFELALIGMLCAIFASDVAAFLRARSLNLSAANDSEYVDLWALGSTLRTETDVLSLATFVIVLRFVKQLRLLPGWGPMLIAVVRTWQDVTVQLYLGVMLIFIQHHAQLHDAVPDGGSLGEGCQFCCCVHHCVLHAERVVLRSTRWQPSVG